MKRSFLFIGLTLLFSFNITIPHSLFAKSPKIGITELSSLQFPAIVAGTTAQSEIVLPGDVGAAGFNITGEPLQLISISILGNKKISKGKNKISVETFYFGGALNAKGLGTFDVGGDLNGVRIGAKINIPANTSPGKYSRRFKLRAVYQ
jgi:hypothetical protein